LHVANRKYGYGSQQNRIVKPSKTHKMIALYIFLGFEAVVLTAWIIYALNNELELYCWINKKRVFCGYFDNLSDLNKHVYKLEALHGESLTDWIIRTVRKHKPVKQVNDTLFVSMMNANLVSHKLMKQSPMAKALTEMQKTIDNTKKAIERTNLYLNNN
jgi:hypothetical protein